MQHSISFPEAVKSVSQALTWLPLLRRLVVMEISLTPDLQAKLTRLAAQQGRAKEALVVEAVERMVRAYRSR